MYYFWISAISKSLNLKENRSAYGMRAKRKGNPGDVQAAASPLLLRRLMDYHSQGKSQAKKYRTPPSLSLSLSREREIIPLCSIQTAPRTKPGAGQSDIAAQARIVQINIVPLMSADPATLPLPLTADTKHRHYGAELISNMTMNSKYASEAAAMRISQVQRVCDAACWFSPVKEKYRRICSLREAPIIGK